MSGSKFLPIAALSLVYSGSLMAQGPVCGGAQDDTWMPPAELAEKIVDMGYVIENMAISEGNCYEMSGMNTQGDPVTAYLDPRTGDLVQEDVLR